MYKRAVGYCMNKKCSRCAKSVFLIGATSYYCGECHAEGHVEPELSTISGTGPFTEVRLEFGYNLHKRTYHKIAIVKDQAAPPGRTYTRVSPMTGIHSERRATKTAENILAVLQQYEPEEDGSLPYLREYILDLDDGDEFSAKLKDLAVGWGIRGCAA